MHKPIIIVQGLQWGSEAKGAVAAYLCLKRDVQYVVRTGAVNAGHTVYWGDPPREFKMQQLPTGWVNPRTKLVLGAGAFIHPEILSREIEEVNRATGEDVRERLLIDDRASLHLNVYTDRAQTADRHHLMGATGKGCSEAIVAKIRERGRGYELFKSWWTRMANIGELPESLRNIRFADTVGMLQNAYDAGEGILLEGTQGSLLDLHLGPYPYTTHKQTQASQWVCEAGLAPGMEYEVVGVARTYPIRVAGNSGPMSNETTWPNLARDLNRQLMRHHMPQRVKSWAIEEFDHVWVEVARSGRFDLPRTLDGDVNYDLNRWSVEDRVKFRYALSEMPKVVLEGVTLNCLEELKHLFEFTTVTKKLRRISKWNADDVAWSARINRVSWVALTFWNYWFPETWGQTRIEFTAHSDRYSPYSERLLQIESQIGCKIGAVSTGPLTSNIIECWR